MNLGEAIRAQRTAKGWTPEQLSDASGVEVGTISALEMRGSSRSKYAAQLAKGLGLSLEQLLAGDAPQAPDKPDQTTLADAFKTVEIAMSLVHPPGLRNLLDTIELLVTDSSNKEPRRQYVLSILSGELPASQDRQKAVNE